MTKDKHQIRVISKQVVTLHDFVFCANIVSSNYRDPNDLEKRYAVANIMPLSEGHIQFLETMRPIEPMDPEIQPLGKRL